MGSRFQPLRGFNDFWGEYCEKVEYISKILRRTAKSFNIKEVSLPILEPLSLFSRGIGETNDASKEIFKLKGDEIGLRPEMTASFMRACINSDIKSGRFFYLDWCFRTERPQEGRRRQFRQFGVEFIGDTQISADLECLEFLIYFFKEMKMEVCFNINFIGSLEEREVYEKELKKFLTPKKEKLSKSSKERLEKNKVFRILDSKEKQDKILLEGAPILSEFTENKEEKKIIETFLKERGVKFEFVSNLVRGLDYYNGFVFEVISLESTAAQNSIVGGGRYDNLASSLDSKIKLAACGFAIGIDRMVPLLKEVITEEKKVLGIILIDNKFSEIEFLLNKLRKNYMIEIRTGNLNNLLREGIKENFDYIFIFGEEFLEKKIIIKNLRNRKQLIFSYEDLLEITTIPF